MPYVGTLFCTDNFVIEELNPNQVRYGIILNLPFRIRIAGLVKIPQVDATIEVWIYNRVAIPADSHLPAVLSALPRQRGHITYDALWSQVIVLLANPKLNEGVVEALKQGEITMLGSGGNLQRIQAVINEVIFASSVATRSLFGGAPIRLLSNVEYYEALCVEFGFLAPPDYPITEQDVRRMVDWRPDRFFHSAGSLNGDLTDLPPEAFANLADIIMNWRSHAFHELAFRAKMAMVASEPLIALVLACAALEGVHAAFLRQVLSERLAERPKGAEGLIEDLLREQGIYTMVQFTSYAFLDASKRPTPEQIDACIKGLQIRNNIVHAKQKKGTYKMREHTYTEVNKAYSAVLKVYECYVSALS